MLAFVDASAREAVPLEHADRERELEATALPAGRSGAVRRRLGSEKHTPALQVARGDVRIVGGSSEARNLVEP